MLTFTGRRNLLGTLIKDTTASILTMCDTLMNIADKHLVQKFYLNEETDATQTTTASTQAYTLPYNFLKMVDVYITVGTTRYLLQVAPSRSFWDTLNYVTYTSDVPAYYFVFDNQLLVYPTPASSSNVITQVYKRRLTDLSVADYTTGTIALTNASATVTGSGTTFTAAMVGRYIQPDVATGGDGNWYQISAFTSTTVLTLANVYQGATDASMSYIIGQVSLLPEDYQELPIYKAAEQYFTTQVIDPNRAAMFKRMYDEGYALMEADVGSKTTDVRIRSNQIGLVNPNLFLRY